MPAIIDLWGANETMLPECGESCAEPANFFFDYFVWLVNTYGDELDIAFSAFMNDPIEIREFGISQDDWVAHLESLRTDTLDSAMSSTFYHESKGHTFESTVYTLKLENQSVADWLSMALAGEHQHTGP